MFDWVLSAMAAGAILTSMFWITVKRPALGMIFFFFFFAFAWRLISALYIDTLGPLFSEQLVRQIGPGGASLPLAVSQGMVVAAILFSFRRQRLQKLSARLASNPALMGPASGWRFGISNLAMLAATIFIVALWIELFVRGSIPLFAGIERYDYARQFAGPLHRTLLRWGPMLAFQLGAFFVAPALRGGSFDRRSGMLFAVLLLYLFFTGHRFSSFYTYAAFFIIPIGVFLLGNYSVAGARHEVVLGKVLRYFRFGSAALFFLIVSALTYSYIVVRRFSGEDLVSKLYQRIFVQQAEMWWMTYERVFLHHDWSFRNAVINLFVAPFDPTRNSTMQFLMERSLPLDRARDILRVGSSYTGGWPEICFEVGGPAGGFIFVAIAAGVFSEFMYLLTRCTLEQRFVTCFFLTPILYALSVTIASGMVNSYIQVTFLIKVVLAMIVYIAEGRLITFFNGKTRSDSISKSLPN
jgi:hypothetical protein